MPTEPLVWLQVAAGAAVLVTGLVVMSWRRALWQAIRKTPGRYDDNPPGGTLKPTRLVVGVVLVIAGYHIAAWALPPDVLAVQLRRERWWVWAVCGLLAVGLSVVLDRMESGSGSDQAKP